MSSLSLIDFALTRVKASIPLAYSLLLTTSASSFQLTEVLVDSTVGLVGLCIKVVCVDTSEALVSF